jgi:MFS family permease
VPYVADFKTNLRWFYAFRFLASLQLWLPIWVLYLQRDRGLTIGQITALDAPFWLIILLAQVPTGAFADRFGRRAALMAGGVIYAAAMLAFGLATSYPFILAAYALWGVAMSFQSGADLAFLYDTLAAAGHGGDYQRAAGRAYGVSAAAGVVALLTGAQLAELTDLNVPILASVGICLLSAGAAWRLREPPRMRRSGDNLLRIVRIGSGVAWRNARLRYMLGLSAVVQAASFVPVIFAQPYLAQYDVPVGDYGVLQTPARLCSVVAALYAYRMARRLGQRRTLMALPVWLVGSMLLLAGLRSPLAFVAFPLMQLALSGANPLLSDYLNSYVPAEQRATILSLGQLLTAMLMVGFEPLLGVVAQHQGIGAAFGVAALLVSSGVVLTLLPWLAIDRRDRNLPLSALMELPAVRHE